MKSIPLAPSALLAMALFMAVAPAAAQEVIRIRTGQVGGAPGSCPSFDERFTYHPSFPAACGQPMRSAAFDATDFAGARTGPAARVVSPFNPWWIVTLPSDPDARWISWEKTGTCNGDVGSVLYACAFEVTTPGATLGDVSACWAADDRLGDPTGGANPVGLYLNGTPLGAAFTGGALDGQTCASQSDVPLVTGVNHLYAYQRDLFCTASGLLLSATITVAPPTAGVDAASRADRLSIAALDRAGASSMRFRLAMPGEGVVRVGVHDVSGRLVRTLLDARTKAGSHELAWDGRDAGGATVPAGVYFVRAVSAGQAARCSAIVIR